MQLFILTCRAKENKFPFSSFDLQAWSIKNQIAAVASLHRNDILMFSNKYITILNILKTKKRLPHFALARGWSVTEVIPTRRDNDKNRVIGQPP
jgi:hypothetical protein